MSDIIDIILPQMERIGQILRDIKKGRELPPTLNVFTTE